MENKKEVLGTAGVVLVLALAGTGLWFFNRQPKAKSMDDGAASIAASTPASSGGLSVGGSGTASNLGQLSTSSQSGVQNGQSAGQGSAAGASPVDPSTFAQYDKYKDNTTALFGDIKAGTGATLGSGQKAVITYKGWLTDGTLFDQSKTNSSGQLEAFSFTMGSNQVIPGLEEGVAGMKVGGSRLVIIPPALGYGSKGQASIPPNSVLVFEVNLVDIQ